MAPKVPPGWSQYNLVWPDEMKRQVDIVRATEGLKDMRVATLMLIREALAARGYVLPDSYENS